MLEGLLFLSVWELCWFAAGNCLECFVTHLKFAAMESRGTDFGCWILDTFWTGTGHMDQAGVVPCWRELCPAKTTTRKTESAHKSLLERRLERLSPHKSLLERKIDSCDLGLVERGGWKAIHCHLGVMDSKDVARRQATAVDRRKGGLGRRVLSRVLGKNGGVCHKQDYFRTTIGLVGNVTVIVTVFWF